MHRERAAPLERRSMEASLVRCMEKAAIAYIARQDLSKADAVKSYVMQVRIAFPVIQVQFLWKIIPILHRFSTLLDGRPKTVLLKAIL